MTAASRYLFRGLPAEKINAIDAICIPQTIAPGQWLFHKADEARNIYLVNEGAIELVMPVEPDIEVPVALIRAGDDCVGVGALPTAVTRLMEKSPGGEIQKAEKRDISILFLGIEGYVRITEQLGATEVNTLTKRYFSVFMDAIYQNNGDVVETAGDGLMVLFMAEDPTRHALEAVQAATTIRQKTRIINEESRLDREPVMINMGISSGRALVGASKFDSYTGGRWTYAAPASQPPMWLPGFANGPGGRDPRVPRYRQAHAGRLRLSARRAG